MKILKVLAIVVIAFFALAIGKDLLAKSALEGGVKVVTGLPLKIGKFHLGLLSQKVDIEKFNLQNPKGYEDRVMADIPKILVDLNLGALFQGKIHVEEIDFHLREFAVVKNSDGTTNLDALNVVKEQQGQEKPKEKEKKPAGKAPDIQIDIFRLQIEQVSLKDYTKGDKPSIKTFKLNINEQFEDITDPNALVKIIMVKALMGTTIGNIPGVNLSAMSDSVSGALASSKQIAADAMMGAKDAAGKAATEAKAKLSEAAQQVNVEKTKEVLGSGGEKVAETADAAAEKAKEAASAVGDSAKKLAGGLLGKVTGD